MRSTGIVFLASVADGDPDRSQARTAWELESMFRRLNEEIADRLRAGFQLRKQTREFGAILSQPEGASGVLQRVWMEVHPLKTRLVLVPGRIRIQTDLWSDRTGGPPGLHQFAGPPLDRAAELLAELDGGPACLDVELDDGRAASHLRQLGTLLHLRLARWTERQLETYRTYRRLGSQRRTAEELGVTQPTVSETLSRVDASATTSALEFFGDELDRRLAEASRRIAARGTAARPAAD